MFKILDKAKAATIIHIDIRIEWASGQIRKNIQNISQPYLLQLI